MEPAAVPACLAGQHQQPAVIDQRFRTSPTGKRKLLEVRYGIGRPIYIRWWKWFISNPWYLIPGLFVIVAVLCYNFVGDGVRDAADPFSHR